MQRYRLAFTTLCAAVVFSSVSWSAARNPIYRDPKQPLEARVADLLPRLTLAEKISLMSGALLFSTQPIERLGIPALKLSDGPNGLRSNKGEAATVFPTGVGMAATWNPRLIEDVGAAIGREARARDVNILLGPNINIQRMPLAGRNFEAYSEDPLLTARMGTAFVKGVQSVGVASTPKHFVANEQELDRQRVSSNVDERTLREIYLAPFEAIVKDARPWALMSSYNRVNGVYMSENTDLVQGVLKRDWGFDGLVMSDWGAVHSTAAARTGLDLEMPGPPAHFGDRLLAAITAGEVQESDVDESVRRLLRTMVRTGVLDGKRLPRGEINSAYHRRLARATADELITLLKNEGSLLPLDPAKLKSIAVIGPNADAAIIQGGGSANVIPLQAHTPWEVLHAELGDRVRVRFAQGVDNEPAPPALDARLLSPTLARTTTGLEVAYYANENFAGRPAATNIDRYFSKLGFGEGITATPFTPFSARWHGYFWPPHSGTYEFSLMQSGIASVQLDGRPLIDSTTPRQPPGDSDIFPMPVQLVKTELQAGRAYPITIEYTTGSSPYRVLMAGMRPPVGTIDAAVEIAKDADVAIVFVGSSTTSDSEGSDRHSFELFGAQNALVEAVHAANPNTIVVLNNGAPVAMPWAAAVPSIIEAWLPGQEGAYALADVLFGKTNPSGKLPVSFPQRLQDNPTYLYYAKGLDANYGEGVFVGYRYYDTKEVAPLFPFGHGLSYTQFEYSNLQMPDHDMASGTLNVSVDIKNSGTRAGQEVAQLYVHDAATQTVMRPSKELKAFEKLMLMPGETKTLHFQLRERDLSYYDPQRHEWVATPGSYQVLIGSSSRDIRVTGSFHHQSDASSGK